MLTVTLRAINHFELAEHLHRMDRVAAELKELPTVTLTLPADEDEIANALSSIGSAISADNNCICEKITDFPPLSYWEGQEMNSDELNYLAKRLKELNPYELDVFGAVMQTKWYGLKDAINITFNLSNYVLVADFGDKNIIGRRLAGASGEQTHLAPAGPDGVSYADRAEEMMRTITPTVTPTGVLYEIRREVVHAYDGKLLPDLAGPQEYILSAVLAGDDPEIPSASVHLPCADAYLESLLLRMRLDSWDDAVILECEYGTGIGSFLRYIRESEETLPALNRMSRGLREAAGYTEYTLDAALSFTGARGAAQVGAVARNLGLFDFYEGVTDHEQLGRTIIEGHMEYSEDLEEYILFEEYGKDWARERKGRFLDTGYICYNGVIPIEELLSADSPDPQKSAMRGFCQ